MRVLLADDHALFLDGLRNLLALHGVQVIGIAHNGMEAFEKTLQLRPDLVLMDMRMPGCDGITALRLIKAEWPECKIVMLTTSTEEADLLEAIRSGASGYLLKSLETGPFLKYLEDVMKGEPAIARELSAILWKEIANQNDAGMTVRNQSPEAELTARQIEILQLVARGLQNKEIAETLCVSEHTVKYHISEILQRLQVKNRDQAVTLALNKGLIH